MVVDSQPKRLQAAVLFLVAVAAIAGVFAAIYFIYPHERQPLLVKRDYRMLAVIAGQVGARIEGLKRAVQTAQDSGADPCGQGMEAAALKCVEVDSRPVMSPAQGGSGVEVHVRNDNGDLKAYFLAHAAQPQETQRPKLPSTDLGRFLDEAVEPYGYFDNVLLASDDGKVLYQSDIPIVDGRALYHSSISTGRIATIQDLIAGEQAALNQEQNKTGDNKQSAYVFSPAENEKVQYLGEEYLLFAQPVLSEVFVADDKGAQHNPSRLVLFGLISTRSFEAESRQIPWAWLGGLVFLLVLIFLSWPLLRLWRMGPGEPLRGVEVRMISFACMAAAMLVTFEVLDQAFYTSIRAQFDDLLEPLAHQIETQFQREIVHADQKLTQVLGDGACRNCEASCAEVNVETGRHFADLILVDSAGNPTCTWSSYPEQAHDTPQLRRSPVPHLPLADRSYFRDACSHVLWSIPDPDRKGRGVLSRVAAEVVSSRISGENVLVVARPAGIMGQCAQPNPPGEPRQPVVALIGTTMMPFTDPVLPTGYGFAVIDDQGDVQIHSQNSRNKRENLFRECDDATGVRAAVGARRPGRLNVSYSGHNYRMYVTPLENTPLSLAVFRDKQLLWAVNSEVVSAWAVLTVLYVALWVAVVIVLQVCDATYTADWLWPCRYGGGSRSYWMVAAQNLILAAIAYLSLERAADFRPFGHAAPLLFHFAMVLIFPAFTLALAIPTLARNGVLGYWEKTIARTLIIAGGVLGGAFLAMLIIVFLDSRSPFNYQIPALALFLILLGAVHLIASDQPSAVVRRTAPPNSPDRREDETRFRFAYVSMLFSLVVALAVVPSMVFFQSARDMEIRNLSRMGQARWVEAVAARAKHLRKQANGKIPAKIVASRLNDTKDIYSAQGFPAEIRWRDSGSSEAVDRELPSKSERPVLLIPELLNDLGLPQLTPLMSFAAELRMMTSERNTASMEPYTWRERAGGGEVMLIDDERLHDLIGRGQAWSELGLRGAGASATSWTAYMRRGFPCFESRQCRSVFAQIALAAILVGFVGFSALWSIACKLFLLDADIKGDDSSATTPADLSDREQLALWHAVRLGFLSPGETAVAEDLLASGVLYRNPAWGVREPELKKIRQLDTAEMARREREARPPAGLRLHQLLPAGIGLAMVFFFMTQRELFNSAIAVVAAVAAALPTVLNFFSQLGGRPEK